MSAREKIERAARKLAKKFPDAEIRARAYSTYDEDDESETGESYLVTVVACRGDWPCGSDAAVTIPVEDLDEAQDALRELGLTQEV